MAKKLQRLQADHSAHSPAGSSGQVGFQPAKVFEKIHGLIESQVYFGEKLVSTHAYFFYNANFHGTL